MALITTKSIITVIFLALFFASAYKLATDDGVSNQIKENLLEQTVSHPFLTSIFVKTLDELTPTLNPKLPFLEKRIFLINEFPLLGYSHVLIAILLIIISSFIMDIIKVNKWAQLGIFILLIIIGYFIGSIIDLLLYNYSANQIGITTEQATLFRQQFSNNYDDVMLPYLLMGIIAFLSIAKVIFKKMKKK